MNFMEVIAEFARVEKGLSIQNPTPMNVAEAYVPCPTGGGPLVDLPCFMHWPTNPTSDRDTATNEDQTFTMRVDFYCTDADNDAGMGIALAFAQETMNAFDAERPYQARFSQTVSDVKRIYGENPFIGRLEWGGLGYYGFSLFVDLEVINNQLVGDS